MATRSSIAWRIPWTEEPGRLQSMGSQELDMTEQLSSSSSHSPHTALLSYLFIWLDFKAFGLLVLGPGTES